MSNSNTKPRYFVSTSNVGGELYFEIVKTAYAGAIPHTITGRGIDALRRQVAILRTTVYRPAKLLGGLDRAFRILAGLPVAEVVS